MNITPLLQPLPGRARRRPLLVFGSAIGAVACVAALTAAASGLPGRSHGPNLGPTVQVGVGEDHDSGRDNSREAEDTDRDAHHDAGRADNDDRSDNDAADNDAADNDARDTSDGDDDWRDDETSPVSPGSLRVDTDDRQAEDDVDNDADDTVNDTDDDAESDREADADNDRDGD